MTLISPENTLGYEYHGQSTSSFSLSLSEAKPVFRAVSFFMAGGALGQVQKAVSQTVEAKTGAVMTQFLREFGHVDHWKPWPMEFDMPNGKVSNYQQGVEDAKNNVDGYDG